jgi:hypothetical protein
MKAYVGVDVYIHVFLTLAPVWGERSASRSSRFTSRKRALVTHWMEDWVGFIAGLDYVEKWKYFILQGLELRPFGRPGCSYTDCAPTTESKRDKMLNVEALGCPHQNVHPGGG